MAKLIPIIPVSRSVMELFLKSTQGMVQRRTWVKDTAGRSGHYRMQWVSPFDAGRGTADHSKQFDLFGEPEPFEKPAEKPAPKAEPAAEMAPEWARLKEGLKFKSGDEVYTVHFERGEVRAIDSKGEMKAGMNYKKADEKLTIADLRTFFTLPEGGEKEPEKPAEKTSKEEKPKAGDYKVYHDTFTGVVDEVIGNLGKQGLYMAEDDVWNKISVGPGKPKDGRTDRYSMPLYDADGKPAGKAAHFQVYDMGNNKYELNLYTSPLRKTEYEEDKVKVRKEAGVTGEKPAEKAEGKADLILTEQFVNMGASVAVADGMWVNYYDSGRMKVGTKKIGSAAEASKEAETFNREIESRTKHKREITNASGEAAMKRFSDAYSKKPDSYAVDYPNRKLGMQRARTRWKDESSPEAMAEIALANMKQGERFRVGRDYFTVTAISDKTLTYTDEKGEKKSVRPNSEKWGQFIRDVGGAMLGWHHGSDAGDLVTAFRRDPAARYENGVLSIRDVGGAMKKSLLDTFREGLSKALGGR